MTIRLLGRAALIAAATLSLVAASAVLATAQEPEPAAVVRVTAPATEGPWPVRFLVGVPDSVELAPGAPCPLAVLDPSSGEPLATQSEPVLRNPDGTTRSLWVSAMIPAGLEAGAALELQVIEQDQPKAGPAISPLVLKALTRQDGWSFDVQGIDGGLYSARFKSAEVVRVGPVEAVYRTTAPVLPVVDEKDPAKRLPHLGVVTLDARVWAGLDVIDLRVLWEGGVVEEPNAWALFSSASLRAPPGARVEPLLPTAGWGGVEQTPAGSIVHLAAAGPQLHATVPHHAKLWSLAVTAPWAWDGLEPIVTGGGWGWAASGPWSPHEAPCTGAQLRLPDMAFLGLQGAQEATRSALQALQAARSTGAPIDGSYGASSWRHPSGIGYGGGTGGQGIEPWPGVVESWSDPAAAFHLLTGQFESRLDRTRVSLIHLDGSTWDPGTATAPFNVAWSPEPLYSPSWQNAWPSYSQDPFGFRGARAAYREATADLAEAALEAVSWYGTDDLQHWVRGRLALWPLVELYAEPMARLVLQRQAAAVRADLFEGGDATHYTSTLAWLATRTGQGQDYGRDFAWAGHAVALAYAAGSDEDRGRLSAWCATWAGVFSGSLTPTGVFQVITNGKEVAFARSAVPGAPPFYPSQTYQNCLVANAGLTMRGAYVAPDARESIDAALSRLAHGVATVAWPAGASQPDYRFAAALEAGGAISARPGVEGVYSSSLHWPAENDDGNRTQDLHVQLAIAAGLIGGPTPELLEAAARYLGPDLLAGARANAAKYPANGLPLVAALEAAE